jgi:hypothetical protein
MYEKYGWDGNDSLEFEPLCQQLITTISDVLQHLLDYKENTACINAANHVKNCEYNWLPNKCITHEVVAVDRTNEYAIIQLNRHKILLCDVCHLVHISLPCLNTRVIDCHIPSYFLCGINNDDKLYFLHPLSNVPQNWVARARNHGDVMSIVKWCNKQDLGLEGCIQGDVIFADVELTV